MTLDIEQNGRTVVVVRPCFDHYFMHHNNTCQGRHTRTHFQGHAPLNSLYRLKLMGSRSGWTGPGEHEMSVSSILESVILKQACL